MGWERRGDKLYYYQTERENGRVKKRYVGTGEIAETVAHVDETRRRVREQRRQRGLEELERMEALGDPLLKLEEATDVLARAHLVAAGYHRHKGEWRRECG